MHKLKKYKVAVDKTHKGLGNLFCFSLVCAKGRKFLLVIAVSGLGKTTAVEAANKIAGHKTIILDGITRSGLKPYEKQLSQFHGSFVLRDLANIDTDYTRKESLKTLVMLTHEHSLSKLNASINLKIEEFYGSAVTTAQPAIMQDIIKSSDWEAVIRDKTVRYYHLIRPIKVNNEEININFSWGKTFEQVDDKFPRTQEFKELITLGLDQWGLARCYQHVHDLLKACAALDGRTKVNNSDCRVLLELTKPLRMEKYLIDKEDFEGKKYFMKSDMCVLTELATYKQLDKTQTATNYQMSSRNLARILTGMNTWFTPKGRDKNVYIPSLQAKQVLEECGYW